MEKRRVKIESSSAAPVTAVRRGILPAALVGEGVPPSIFAIQFYPAQKPSAGKALRAKRGDA